jgi:NhaA family Na+:H+ antiporter
MEDPVSRTWTDPTRNAARRFVRPLQDFIQTEASSGIVMLAAAIVAIVWANSPWFESYFALLETEILIELGPIHFEEDLLHFINDGLMAIFFFVVGLEIKRELAVGELRDPKVAVVPAIAALGGMVLPALIYILFVGLDSPASHGWGIPMATDIAFSLGIAALLGSRVPLRAKLFLLALAIADDIGAIAVIAVFYTEELHIGFMIASLVGIAVVWVSNKLGVRSILYYVVVGAVVWYLMLESGVHATIAGVVLGLLTPARPLLSGEEFDRRARRIIETYPALVRSQADREKIDHEAQMLAMVATESVSPLNRLEHALVLWSSFVIVPIFALANAGVRFAGISITEAITSPVTLGVGAGLLVGKAVGVPLFTWFAVRFKLGELPAGVTWGHVMGLGALAGIGFTVALFIAGLAFEDDAVTGDLAKIGIFTGSLLAGIVGFLILRFMPPMKPSDRVMADA